MLAMPHVLQTYAGLACSTVLPCAAYRKKHQSAPYALKPPTSLWASVHILPELVPLMVAVFALPCNWTLCVSAD